MNDRVLKPQLLYNNSKSNNPNSTIGTLNITNTLNQDSCDQDFYEIYHIFTMILTQDINKLCNKESVLRIPIIPPAIVTKLCKSVKTLFETENILLRLQGQMIIVGDLHGHILDLFRIIKRFGLPPRVRYLFLGDIVDRGEFSLETIIFIYAMKALFPNEIYIIRGNHEFEEICSLSGFLDDILATYKSRELFSFFIESFDVMPIAAIINDSILCVHAGIGPNIHSITDIVEEPNNNEQSIDFNNGKQNTNIEQKQYLIQRPIHDFSNDIIASLMWSDPTEKRQENRKELPSLISPLTGARILTVRPVVENKRSKRAISNDFNINQLKLAFPKNPESEGGPNNNLEPSHLANIQTKNNESSKPDEYTELNNNPNYISPTITSNTRNTHENSHNHISLSANSSNLTLTTFNFSNSNNLTTNANNLTCNDQPEVKYSEGFSPSSRGYGYLFDKSSFDIFMTNSKLSLLLRGHQCVRSGVSSTFDSRLMTVFSASHYCGTSNNSSGVFIISKLGNRTEVFKSLNYLRRDLVVFIPPESDDSFVIPKSFQTTETTASTARPRLTSCPPQPPQPSQPPLQQQQSQLQQPLQVGSLQSNVKKKAQIFSPASLIATKHNNPLATFNANETAKSEDDDAVDPFEIKDENEDDDDEESGFCLPSFGGGGCGAVTTRASKRHSALSQFTSFGCHKKMPGRSGAAGPGFASDEQEITSRRFLRLPCINGTKKPVFYGDA